MRSYCLLIALPALVLLLSACKGPCRQLSEKLCECSESTLLKEACLRRAANEDGRIAPTEEQNAVCAELLPGCDCHTISTPEGKRACGLSR